MCDANHVFAFVLCSHRKFITLRVLDREEYEKECSFFLVLGDPVWLRRGVKGVRVKPDQLSRRCRPLSLCLPTLTLLSPRTLAPGRFCPPSFEAWPLHLFCSVFFPLSFLGGLRLAPQGTPAREGPGAPGQGDGERRQPPPRDILRALPRHVAASFNRVGNAVSRSEKAMLHHFYRKIK